MEANACYCVVKKLSEYEMYAETVQSVAVCVYCGLQDVYLSPCSYQTCVTEVTPQTTGRMCGLQW
jgi:hypothetical protein